jgi:N utilization substance protein B
VLFEAEGEDGDLESAIRYHAEEEGAPEDVVAFASAIVHGVANHQHELDSTIAEASKNWRLEQMSKVDRVILRIAIYEISIARDVPVKAAINESIELAKTFSGEDSGRFVNGILGRVAAAVAG